MSLAYTPEVGLLRKGILQDYNPIKRSITVLLEEGHQNYSGNIRNKVPHKIIIPMPMFSNSGLFIGAIPEAGTPVIVGQGQGNEYYFVSFYPQNLTKLPSLEKDTLFISANNNTRITLNTSNDINIGSLVNKIHINTSIKDSYVTSTIDNEFKFTQALRKVDGVIKRVKDLNINYPTFNLLKNDNYLSELTTICLDPNSSENIATNNDARNPPFVESRELVYEHFYDAKVESNLKESLYYSKSGANKEPSGTAKFPDRRDNRANTLSLSQLDPNSLIETIKGTVVDTFGNILDINRAVLPVGQGSFTLNQENVKNKVKAFNDIKSLERKSIAFHFELNAKKDFSKNQLNLNSNEDNSKQRSRLSIDFDKEGLFKINIPATSENGNVPLLTRYENYSEFSADNSDKPDQENPNKLLFRDDLVDIVQDSFAAKLAPNKESTDLTRGVISVKKNGAEATPLDRITKTHIKYGTAHHDITNTCITHQSRDFINYQYNNIVDIDNIPVITNIVSPVIEVGDNANAGGRSGQVNLDGSLDLSIGANTVDRQSLLLDLAGGVVSNIGRDKNGNSISASADGYVNIQIGGYGISDDSRFKDENNGFKAGALDIRVFTSGKNVTLLRIDDNGITIMGPQGLTLSSNGDLIIRSTAKIAIEAEEVSIQERFVNKTVGGMI